MAHFDYFANNGYDEQMDDDFFAIFADYCDEAFSAGTLISRGVSAAEDEGKGKDDVFVYLNDDTFSSNAEALSAFLFDRDEDIERAFEQRARDSYAAITGEDWPDAIMNGDSTDDDAMFDAIESALLADEFNLIGAPHAAWWIRNMTDRTLATYCGELYDRFIRDHNIISTEFFWRISPYQMTSKGIDAAIDGERDHFWEALPGEKSQLYWIEKLNEVHRALNRDVDAVNWEYDASAQCYH